MKRLKKRLPMILTLVVLAATMCASGQAAAGARQGLRVCAASLAPSLFPFFVLSNLLSAMGLADLLAGRMSPVMRRLFRVSGAGAQAFFLGITGGYPLGAAAVARLRKEGYVSRREGETLLAFCNNSGPAFILGAVGGIFHSPAAGLLLYITHVLAAICVGLILRGDKVVPKIPPRPVGVSAGFTAAFSGAVSRAVTSTITVCGYVVFFSALLGLMAPLMALPPVGRALAAGVMELGSGISALNGLVPTPETLCAAAMMLGWGGLSVHCQTMASVEGTDIKCARHLAGRALCSVIAAVFTYIPAVLLFS